MNDKRSGNPGIFVRVPPDLHKKMVRKAGKMSLQKWLLSLAITACCYKDSLPSRGGSKPKK